MSILPLVIGVVVSVHEGGPLLVISRLRVFTVHPVPVPLQLGFVEVITLFVFVSRHAATQPTTVGVVSVDQVASTPPAAAGQKA
jgi:hypothetical protein